MSDVVEKREAALRRANEVRLGRARVKRDLTAGRLTLEEALGLDCCQSAQVLELVLALPHWGRVRGVKALRRAEVSELRRVGALTDRQVRAVLEETTGRFESRRARVAAC